MIPTIFYIAVMILVLSLWFAINEFVRIGKIRKRKTPLEIALFKSMFVTEHKMKMDEHKVLKKIND